MFVSKIKGISLFGNPAIDIKYGFITTTNDTINIDFALLVSFIL
jgi:hypothetical protein